jgi:hypothetical protein
MVAEVAADPLVSRLLSVFSAMPAQDRNTVVGVLEREVEFRRLTQGTEAVTGWQARPNPRARLYTRAVGAGHEGPRVSRDEMVLAILRCARVMHLLLSPDLRTPFRRATREAFALIESDERAALATVMQELLDALAESARAETNGDPVVVG